MGYDNECVVNILSLPGEYFCPVCRTLIYPNEALQSQCTHLYCKLCLAYVVATTHACPYDGYLVTETDSKPLVESNKELAETIGKVVVHCLYHRSGCQWQGTLAESTAHCAACNYGNSAVVCNRCGTQIIHRQVQEHAQICPGVQPQGQVVENAQTQAAIIANQAVSQDPSSAASAAPAAITAATTAVATPSSAAMTASVAPASSAPASAPAVHGQAQVQGAAAVYPQAAAQAPTSEQWYQQQQQQQQQQQYQQYYQQYPGYDPYQQQYQQYAQYQQQVYPQHVQPQMQAAPQQAIPGQQQQQPYMQQPLPGQPQAPQVQPQAHPQPQPQPQPHAQTQPQPYPQHQPPPQLPQMQAQQPLVTQQPHAHAHAHAHAHLPTHGHPAGHPFPQPQPHASQAHPTQLQAPSQHQQPVPAQSHPPQLQGPPQHQQPIPPQAHPQQLQGPPHQQQPVPPQQLSQQIPHPQAYPQHQLRPQHTLSQPQHQPQQLPMQMQPQPQSHTHPQPTLQMQPVQPSAHPVSGYQSYPQPIPGPPQQQTMHMQTQPQGMPPQQQFPPHQPPQMRPPPPQTPMPVHQQPTMPPPQSSHHAPQQGQHLVHQSGQQVYQQSGMQPPGQHGFPQPHAHVPSHLGQPAQQGPAPPQHQVHPQQSFRPQGQALVQQPTHGHPHQQGLPSQQAQARPMLVNHGMSQQSIPQSPGGGSKPMLPGMSQQSPNQNYMGRTNPRGPMDSEPQSRPLQQYSGSQGGVVSASPPTPAQGVSTADKTTQLQTSAGELAFKNDEGTKSGEKISEHACDSKPNGDDEGKCSADAKPKDGQADNDNKDVSKTREGNVDGPPAKLLKGDEGINTSSEVTENIARAENENQGSEGRPDEKSGAVFKRGGSHLVPDAHTHTGTDKSVNREHLRPNLDRNQGFVSDGQIAGAAVNNMLSQQMQVPGSLDRSHLQQPAHQNVFPAQAPGYTQPGYNDRNPSQFPQQYSVSDDRQGIPPGAPQQIPFGQPLHMPDTTLISQMPPAHDRMFSQPMHQSSQERRFPEPSSNQMHAYGQTMPPGQFRPPGHSVNESFPNPKSMPPAQEARWPPPHTGGGASSHHVFPPKGFEQQGMAPPGQAPSHLPPGARTALGDPLARPTMGVQPPGSLGMPNRIGGHPFIPDDKMGMPHSKNAMEVEAHKRPGFYEGRQPEPHRPLTTEHSHYGETNVMKMNGRSNNIPAGGMHDSFFPRGLPEGGFPEDRFRHLPEDRFKPFPEEGFKAAHDEQFSTSTLDPSRHIVNRREFEEDLKQFPRPGHLDGEGPCRFDGYLSSSMPLDRMPLQSGGNSALTSRPPSGALFPPGIGGPDVHMDIGDRDRPVALHEHMIKRHDATFPPPDRVNPVSEFGRHRVDGLPPPRSPGHFSRDVPDGMLSQLRGLDGSLGTRNHNVPSNLQGSGVGGPQNMPSFFRGGGFSGFHSHLDISDSGGPGNLPPHLRIGDPGFNGRFNSGTRESDVDSFDQSRKKKTGGTVRCLICKVDCETVEGLELHSQRREHQKKAMDIVLSIKKENVNKHRTSGDVTPFEGANKSRKANFGKRVNTN